MTENERLLKRCKDKCATGEALSEAEARWLVGEVLALQARADKAEAAIGHWQRLVAFLRERLAKSQKHNREAATYCRASLSGVWQLGQQAAAAELAEVRAERDRAEAACAQMRQALLSCQNLIYSTQFPDSIYREIVETALATDAGATLLAELAALRAVAEAARRYVLDQTVNHYGQRYRDLAALLQAQQTAHGGQGTALQAKDEAEKGSGAPGGQQNG